VENNRGVSTGHAFGIALFLTVMTLATVYVYHFLSLARTRFALVLVLILAAQLVSFAVLHGRPADEIFHTRVDDLDDARRALQLVEAEHNQALEPQSFTSDQCTTAEPSVGHRGRLFIRTLIIHLRDTVEHT